MQGAQQAGTWAVRETFVAVVVTNLPVVYQGYRKLVYPRLVSYFVSQLTNRSEVSAIQHVTDSTSNIVAMPPIRKEVLATCKLAMINILIIVNADRVSTQISDAFAGSG